MSKKSQTVKSPQTDNIHAPFKCDIMVVKQLLTVIFMYIGDVGWITATYRNKN